MERQLEVLIIEDDDGIRDILKGMLYTFGVHNVLEAVNGNEALEFIEDDNTKIDVIFCDWNLPQISGAAILKKIRSSKHKLPFIMITGRNDLDSVTEAKKLGATAYIAKPFSMKDIKSKLEFAVGEAPTQVDNTKPQAPNVPETTANSLDELERLAVLKEKGHLSEEEFETEKKKLLGYG